MKCKRLFSLFLAAALAVGMALPAGAVNSSFSDVTDAATAVNADVLHLMGVVAGVGGSHFNPGANLTRAEFCTMVVKFMQKGDQVPLQSTRAIFSDVTAKHWALGYVNLAASTTVADGEKASTPLISGVGNGKFEPDSKITFAQAATILIRVLGYSSEQVGALWPQSYMNKAKSIGLSDGINAGYNAPITRAQAAQLFVNALSCKTGSGSEYYSTLGTVSNDIVLLAVNVTSEDGQYDGAVRTSGGTYLPHAEGVKPTGLQGKRGALVVNDKKELVTFVPDDSSSVTVTLSGSAQPSYVKGTNGKQYAISANTPVYTSDKTESSTYLSAYPSLSSGTQVTLFSERGKVVAVYAATGTSADSDAIVVTGSANSTMFLSLTGGATGYKIQKNRQAISMSDIKPYDVVTYDSINNTLIVSDLHLTCVYEDAAPSAKAPETITVLGHSFPVLESAWDTVKDFSVGDVVSLLLTSDGKVAGMAKSSVRSSAIGMVSGSTATVFLPAGGSIELKSDREISGSNVENQLVTISSSSRGRIYASKLASSAAPGELNLKNMTLGSYTVTAGVRLYEQVGSAMAQIDLSGLVVDSISANSIASYHLNSSNMVDYLILKAVTGDAYVYGKLTRGEQTGGSEMTYTNQTVSVANGSGGMGTHIAAFSFKDGGFGGVAAGFGDLDGTPKAASVIELTELKKVSPTDFFENQGTFYLRSGSKTYQVSDKVECYKAATKSWFTEDSGADRLAACKAFSNDLTVYLDPIGEKVRIVVAN